MFSSAIVNFTSPTYRVKEYCPRKSSTIETSSLLSIMTPQSSFLWGKLLVKPCLCYAYLPFHVMKSWPQNFCLNLFIVSWSILSGKWKSIIAPYIVWNLPHNYSKMYVISVHGQENCRRPEEFCGPCQGQILPVREERWPGIFCYRDRRLLWIWMQKPQ